MHPSNKKYPQVCGDNVSSYKAAAIKAAEAFNRWAKKNINLETHAEAVIIRDRNGELWFEIETSRGGEYIVAPSASGRRHTVSER